MEVAAGSNVPKPTPKGIDRQISNASTAELSSLHFEGLRHRYFEEDSESEVSCGDAGWAGERGTCAKARKKSSPKYVKDDLDVLLLSASLLVTVLGIVTSVFWCLPSARRSALMVFEMMEAWWSISAPSTVSTWMLACLIPLI